MLFPTIDLCRVVISSSQALPQALLWRGHVNARFDIRTTVGLCFGVFCIDDVASLDAVSDDRPASRQQRVFTDASTGSLGVMSLLHDTSKPANSPSFFEESSQQANSSTFDVLNGNSDSSPFGISIPSSEASSKATKKQSQSSDHLASANHSKSSSTEIPAEIYKVETPPVVVDNSIQGRMRSKAREFRQMNLEYWRSLQAIAVEQVGYSNCCSLETSLALWQLLLVLGTTAT